MICANVRNSPNLRVKCNIFVNSPFGYLANIAVILLLLTPQKTINSQLLIPKIDP